MRSGFAVPMRNQWTWCSPCEESGWVADHLHRVDWDLADVGVDVVNGFVNETRQSIGRPNTLDKSKAGFGAEDAR
jgi:hypothetical protein